MLDEFYDVNDKIEYGSALGKFSGLVAGVVATALGGYELGTAINNFMDVEGTFGRGAIDSLTMAVVAGPAIVGSGVAGNVVGGLLGAVSHPIIGIYQYFKRD